tara:strand:+ start:1430 stop:2713 length:1284 start_codon:yes stop_codon:yes gene_type:complete
MKQIQHPKTPLFRAAITFAVLLFSSASSASVQGSLLEGEDTEEKVQYAIGTFTEEKTPDLSAFEGLTGRGEDHMFDYEKAVSIFEGIGRARNAMIQALNLMYEEDSTNKKANNRFALLNLTDVKGYPHDFQPGLNWGTILIKLELLPKALPGLVNMLKEAFEDHKALKVKRLQNAYSALAVQVLRSADVFDTINDLYPKPEKPVAENVSGDDLDTLKQKLSDFEKDVLAYDMDRVKAETWERAFKKLHAQHAPLVKAQEKLEAAFEVLRQANDQNPNVKEVGDLPDISGEGDLATLKEILDDIAKAQSVLTESLAQAKTWQKAFEMHHKKYALLTAEQEKLEAAFEDLKKVNGDNPNVKDVGDLPEIAGEGDLATIKGILDDIARDQGLLSGALVLAKAWKPEVAVEEKLDEGEVAVEEKLDEGEEL